MAEALDIASSRVPVEAPDLKRWWLPVIYTLFVLALYYPTAWSIVSIWERSDTFAHGYLIVPIALWVIWEKRSVLAALRVQPDLRIVLLMVPIGCVWLVASLVNVQVVQQLALVGLLISGIWAIVGNIVARVLAFPLGFLFLAVPMGEDLVPPMMELTARSTVWLVQLTGIPVYREGMYFTLPSGNWSVVEACSGFRYLLASFTLGVLYAYLTYRSLSRRLLFALAAFIVPVLANLVRAYIIVMLGHLSGMTIATGVDHLLYGWVFFGIVMFLLFWLGSFWREDVDSDEQQAVHFQSQQKSVISPVAPWLAMLIVCAVAAIWPVFAVAIDKLGQQKPNADLVIPESHQPWSQVPEVPWDWQPESRGADREVVSYYRNGERLVALYLQQHLQQKQGKEIVDSRRHFRVKQEHWRILSQEGVEIILKGEATQAAQAILQGTERNLLAWTWYRIGDRYVANPYEAKLLEIWQKLTFGRPDAARIVLVSEDADTRDAAETLHSFLSAHLINIEASLDSIVAGDNP